MPVTWYLLSVVFIPVVDEVKHLYVMDWFVGSRGQQQPVPEPCKAPPDYRDTGAPQRTRDPESL